MGSKNKRRSKKQKSDRKQKPGESIVCRGDTNQLSQDANHLVFQDVMNEFENDPTTAFFELANAPCIHYRLDPILNEREPQSKEESSTPKSVATITTSKRKRDALPNNIVHNNNMPAAIRIQQDSQAKTHTGGVVWETSYLLLEYLLFLHRTTTNDNDNKSAADDEPSNVLGPNLVEIGAGCGLLGLALAAQLPPQHLKVVVLTETHQVLETLLAPNVQTNLSSLKNHDHVPQVSACALDWTQFRQDTERQTELHGVKFDTIVGTDVVFSPTLVEPMLASLQFLSREGSTVYLCLQPDRCPKSFNLLRDKAPDYNFTWETIALDDPNNESLSFQTFAKWGQALECRLIRMCFKARNERVHA